MKYLTKEWYGLLQKTGFHILLVEEKDAEIFSEDYFQRLYKQKLEEFYNIFREVALLQQIEFDQDQTSKQFEDTFIFNLEQIKRCLSQEILNKIPDIRVFALNKASKEVIKEVTQFCEENETLVESVRRKYQAYYKKALTVIDNNIIKNINFHDCVVKETRQTEDSFIITFVYPSGYTDVQELHLKNYKILKQELPILENLCWLYEEIYWVDNKYELHVLFIQSDNINTVEFTVSAENISFV
ncbi:uncharacterized protein DUF4085 [Natranaerovirga pectinivora]|uniref:Uncharacterized protein DUF4085 n=1 Tax=Natranaerovirga pectinivora TaxID=682400 RepID=A0A4R3MPH8_9FIRM|nr:DUF4085 family protein [Natranaerovirga pectinivora]TCT17207.1 uncharacterized protein DUF4085 [Natranaerovirga pectinivora]